MSISARSIALLLAAVVSGGCGDDPEPAPFELEVMSFNVRWEVPGRDGKNAWVHRRAMVYSLLSDPGLDVAGLQEVTPSQLADIRAAVPTLEVHDADPRMNGIAILYRTDRLRLLEKGAFWFSRTPDVPESRDWHSESRRHVCAWVHLESVETGRAFYVYDLHLDLDERSRRLSAVLLGERIAARGRRDPVIVLGDFNAPESEACSRYLRGEIDLPADGSGGPIPEPLVDTFRLRHPHVGEVGTGNAFRGRTSGPKIDYVYISRGVRVLDARIDRFHVNGAYPSDHFPVRARLLLSGRTVELDRRPAGR